MLPIKINGSGSGNGFCPGNSDSSDSKDSCDPDLKSHNQFSDLVITSTVVSK